MLPALPLEFPHPAKPLAKLRIGVMTHSFKELGGQEEVVLSVVNDIARKGHEVTLISRAMDRIRGRLNPAVRTLDVPTAPEVRYSGAHLLGDMVHLGSFGLLSKRWGRTGVPSRRLRKEGEALTAALAALDILNVHDSQTLIWAWAALRKSRRKPSVLWFCHEPSRSLYRERVVPNWERKMRLVYELEPELRKTRQSWRYFMNELPLQKIRHRRMMALDKKAGRAVDRILVASSVTETFARAVYGRAAEVVHLAPVPPPPRPFSLSDVPVLTEACRGRFFLGLSRMSAEKNFLTVLKAVSRIRKLMEERSVCYVAAGTGPQLPALRAWIRRKGLDPLARFVGYVDAKHKWDLFRRAEFFVFVPFDEPFGLVPLEAALVGTPSLLADNAGTGYVAGKLGLDPVAADDDEALAARMEDWIRHPEKTRRLGESVREQVEAKFSHARFLQNYREQIEGLAPRDRAKGCRP